MLTNPDAIGNLNVLYNEIDPGEAFYSDSHDGNSIATPQRRVNEPAVLSGDAVLQFNELVLINLDNTPDDGLPDGIAVASTDPMTDDEGNEYLGFIFQRGPDLTVGTDDDAVWVQQADVPLRKVTPEDAAYAAFESVITTQHLDAELEEERDFTGEYSTVIRPLGDVATRASGGGAEAQLAQQILNQVFNFSLAE